jgi:hypothetical protein
MLEKDTCPRVASTPAGSKLRACHDSIGTGDRSTRATSLTFGWPDRVRDGVVPLLLRRLDQFNQIMEPAAPHQRKASSGR